jgi:hypothetical protein
MRAALLGILLAQLMIPAAAPPRPPEGLFWWVTQATSKVRPDDPLPPKLAQEVGLHAARNEFEAFQIVLHSSEEMSGLDVTVTDLEDGRGHQISADSINTYLVGTVPVRRPSRENGETGDWPDPLLPRVDSWFREKRNAFPFSLESRRNQAVWIDVYVPRDTRAGIYQGFAKVTGPGTELFKIPIRVTVWNFELPSTSSFRTSFGFTGRGALKQHKGKYTSDADLREISVLYSKAALQHRISLHGGTFIPPPFSLGDTKATLDWREYDREEGAFLNGTVFGPGDPLPGARYTSIDLRTHGSADTDLKKTLYWREWARHFREKGWLDRLFFYVKDEPAEKDYPEVARLASLAHEADPGIKTLVTVQRTASLVGRVDIWTPLINCFELKPGFDGFCSETVPRSGYDADLRKDGQLWWYQSCGSHGCNIVGGPYFKGWPSYMIDDTAVSNRIMPWLAWRYRVSGELYFNINEAFNHSADLWKGGHFLFGGNGDGTLMYPGRAARIGGRHDIPIESVRLKLIREGLEDYEYFVLLDRAADSHVARIARSLYEFEHDSHKLHRERIRMGEEIAKRVSFAGDKS